MPPRNPSRAGRSPWSETDRRRRRISRSGECRDRSWGRPSRSARRRSPRRPSRCPCATAEMTPSGTPTRRARAQAPQAARDERDGQRLDEGILEDRCPADDRTCPNRHGRNSPSQSTYCSGSGRSRPSWIDRATGATPCEYSSPSISSTGSPGASFSTLKLTTETISEDERRSARIFASAQRQHQKGSRYEDPGCRPGIYLKPFTFLLRILNSGMWVRIAIGASSIRMSSALT